MIRHPTPPNFPALLFRYLPPPPPPHTFGSDHIELPAVFWNVFHSFGLQDFAQAAPSARAPTSTNLVPFPGLRSPYFRRLNSDAPVSERPLYLIPHVFAKCLSRVLLSHLVLAHVFASVTWSFPVDYKFPKGRAHV